LTQAASNPPARAWDAPRMVSALAPYPGRMGPALRARAVRLGRSGSQTIALWWRVALCAHLPCRRASRARSVPGSKLPPFTQHWTRCELGVTAGSRDCFGKAKLRIASSNRQQETDVFRLIVFTFILSLASSVQAMPVSPVQTPDNVVVKVRQGCGAGYQRIAGRCVRNASVRHFRRIVRRCPGGLRLVDGKCTP
jgi:hypothetical protein